MQEGMGNQSRRRNQAQHGLRISHVAKRGSRKRPTMFRVGHCRAGIWDKEHLVFHHLRIPCRRFAADMGQRAGNDERVYPTVASGAMNGRVFRA